MQLVSFRGLCQDPGPPKSPVIELTVVLTERPIHRMQVPMDEHSDLEASTDSSAELDCRVIRGCGISIHRGPSRSRLLIFNICPFNDLSNLITYERRKRWNAKHASPISELSACRTADERENTRDAIRRTIRGNVKLARCNYRSITPRNCRAHCHKTTRCGPGLWSALWQHSFWLVKLGEVGVEVRPENFSLGLQYLSTLVTITVIDMQLARPD